MRKAELLRAVPFAVFDYSGLEMFGDFQSGQDMTQQKDPEGNRLIDRVLKASSVRLTFNPGASGWGAA